jgi:hypothetical protein
MISEPRELRKIVPLCDVADTNHRQSQRHDAAHSPSLMRSTSGTIRNLRDSYIRASPTRSDGGEARSRIRKSPEACHTVVGAGADRTITPICRRFDAPGRIRTCDPRIRSRPTCLRKRRFSRLFKPILGGHAEILLSDKSRRLCSSSTRGDWIPRCSDTTARASAASHRSITKLPSRPTYLKGWVSLTANP